MDFFSLGLPTESMRADDAYIVLFALCVVTNPVNFMFEKIPSPINRRLSAARPIPFVRASRLKATGNSLIGCILFYFTSIDPTAEWRDSQDRAQPRSPNSSEEEADISDAAATRRCRCLLRRSFQSASRQRRGRRPPGRSGARPESNGRLHESARSRCG